MFIILYSQILSSAAPKADRIKAIAVMLPTFDGVAMTDIYAVLGVWTLLCCYGNGYLLVRTFKRVSLVFLFLIVL